MRQTGTVKFFDERKGFGFIVPDAGEKDVFVHSSAIAGSGRRTLRDGARVEFAIARDHQDRVIASEVRVVKERAPYRADRAGKPA